MALGEYRRKRDPKATPEPFSGGRRGRRRAPIFVVQRHDARSLHYDFRLERDGALASWAVPKGVPLEPGQQRLAVHVEDHPLSYADFEGTIPAGQYGAGTVEIWDRGTYELVEEKPDGGLTFRLEGERLRGTWALVPAKLSGDPKNWLLLRKRDASGSESQAQSPAPPRTRDGGTSGRAGARGSEPRMRYAPMLATLASAVPRGEGWLYEVKWDGYRALCTVSGGGAQLVSRRGNDLTERFATVARELPRAVRADAVLDGEVVALDESGRASFSAMQQGRGGQLLYLFDVLEIDGEPVVSLPFAERRERLKAILEPDNPVVRLSEAFEDGDALYEAAKEQGLEGIVAKRAASPYAVGKRTRDWLKVKTHHRQEFVIAGYTKGHGRRAGSFGSLVLGVRRGSDLSYVGNVGTGFDEAEIRRLVELLRPLARKASPFPVPPKLPRVKKGDVVWVEPRLVAEVEFVEWTHDGHLRAPSYQGLREDKAPEEVRREEPIEEELRYGRKTLRLSNLDKPFWPEEGITKGDLLAYYRAVAPVLVPHLRDRPFTMKRYPDGWQGGHFFQKDAPTHMPEWIPRRRFLVSSRDRARTKKWIDAPLVNDEPSLLWMVNMGCIDLNTWYSRVDRPDRPDWVLFDLDPSPDVGFPEAVQVALLVREILDALGLVGFPKTSGSRGIHVLVPVERRYTYADTREFAEIVAGALVRTHRGLVTTEWTKSKRRGVLLDANQNGEGKTIASVYSVRPRAGAHVSTPVRWGELGPDLDPARFTMDAVLERIRRDGDLYAEVLTTRQRLDRALAALS
ncbi:MAG TPA: DNA ligase D [Gaiellaceae bacterium]|nr:DNA ligase D [Gaiellaceae bacterium]